MSEKTTNLSEYIRESFGTNASYVEGLLNRFQTDPNSVDESWRTYFIDLLNGGMSPANEQNNGKTAAAVQTPENKIGVQPAAVKAETPNATPEKKSVSASANSADIEVKLITGASKKIVENMEQSLTVPTATSLRRVPVKVLEENRRIINKHLQTSGRGKVSFTHLIAWAIVKSIKEYPQMNFGFGLVDDKPSRLQHEKINLGIAIDIEKKDGSRNLLVPSIKGVNRMSFAEFFAAYNETVKKARDGKLTLEDFQGTTVSLTNPGTIGTVASNPRLMSGQGVIVATGAIEYPAEYQAMTSGVLSQIGISMLFAADAAKTREGVLAGNFWSEFGEPSLDEGTRQFADQLALGTLKNVEAIDEKIRTRAEHWRIERMAIVDRNVLRLAVYEFLYDTTPHTVVINEALEIARRFSTFEATQFINGILDAIKHDLEKDSLPENPKTDDENSSKKTHASST